MLSKSSRRTAAGVSKRSSRLRKMLLAKQSSVNFGNIADILPTKKWRKDCGFDQGCDVGASQLDSMGLWKADVKVDNLWCMVHKCRHSLWRADVHIAGTTCTDHSSYGSMNKDEGEQVKFFMMWCALRRKLKEPLLVHENVSGLGVGPLQRYLGDLYFIFPMIGTPIDFGFPIAWKRQMTIMVLKDWLLPQMQNAGEAGLCNTASLRSLIGFEKVMAACFCRSCSLHWAAWRVSDAEELFQEKAWASQRPGVQKRWEAVAKGEATCITKNKLQMQTFGDDDNNSILACLLPTERKRLEDVRLNHPSAILFDVSQNSSARCRVVKEGSTCFTLVASQGITVFLLWLTLA